MRISFPREKADAIRRLLRDQGPTSRRQAKARDVLSMAGKLWNLTHVVQAGRYFVWRLLRLTGLHDSRGSKNQNHTVELGREFTLTLFFGSGRLIELLLEEEALSAPCYTAIRRPPKRHYLSDASFEAVGGFCVERKVLEIRHAEKTDCRTQEKSRLPGDLYHPDKPIRVTGNGCDSVGHARTSRRPAGCKRGPHIDER